MADAQYKEEHSNIDFPDAMTVNAWFEYWIGIKKRTVKPNTVRNYTERYHRNIEPIIGNKMLGSVNTIHCQTIMNRMADEGYRTSTIYQTRIALFIANRSEDWRDGGFALVGCWFGESIINY